MARVNWQLRVAERTYVATRSRHDLLALRDLKHQLWRMLDAYARRWGRSNR
jgi:hypothetical protein